MRTSLKIAGTEAVIDVEGVSTDNVNVDGERDMAMHLAAMLQQSTSWERTILGRFSIGVIIQAVQILCKELLLKDKGNWFGMWDKLLEERGRLLSANQHLLLKWAYLSRVAVPQLLRLGLRASDFAVGMYHIAEGRLQYDCPLIPVSKLTFGILSCSQHGRILPFRLYKTFVAMNTGYAFLGGGMQNFLAKDARITPGIPNVQTYRARYGGRSVPTRQQTKRIISDRENSGIAGMNLRQPFGRRMSLESDSFRNMLTLLYGLGATMALQWVEKELSLIAKQHNTTRALLGGDFTLANEDADEVLQLVTQSSETLRYAVQVTCFQNPRFQHPRLYAGWSTSEESRLLNLGFNPVRLYNSSMLWVPLEEVEERSDNSLVMESVVEVAADMRPLIDESGAILLDNEHVAESIRDSEAGLVAEFSNGEQALLETANSRISAILLPQAIVGADIVRQLSYHTDGVMVDLQATNSRFKVL